MCVCNYNLSLWRSRNARVWENTVERAEDIVYYSKSLLEEYVACRGAGSNSQNQPWSRTTHQWTRPQESFIKCNKVGIGIFLGDENGMFQHFSIVMGHGYRKMSASFGLIQNKCRKDFGTSLMTYTMYLLLTQFPTNVDIFSKFKLLYNIIE
jgi:hypothetical protein